jgi:hypothetical protein
MLGLDLFELPDEIRRKLPLGFRVLYCKQLTGDGGTAGVYQRRIDGSSIVPSRGRIKPISKVEL